MAETSNPVLRVLTGLNVEPDLALEVVEYIRKEPGQNITDVLGARIDAQGARIDAQGDRIEALGAEVRSALDARTAELRGVLDARTAELRGEIAEIRGMLRTSNRLNTALVVILGTAVFAILVQVLGIGPS